MHSRGSRACGVDMRLRCVAYGSQMRSDATNVLRSSYCTESGLAPRPDVRYLPVCMSPGTRYHVLL